MPDANAKSRPIYVVVVEYHQHALEHIHSILRRRKSLKSWSMLHFDAHPDLACPNNDVSALSCFLPRQDKEQDLYERLDSHSSGIAEWILPLVLAGGLEHVHWIKPPESQQLPTGNHEYNVGAWIPPTDATSPLSEVATFLDLPSSAAVRVDWKVPYYLDDASAVSKEELLLAKTLQLKVSELEEETSQAGVDDASSSLLYDGDWSLDICLDYFYCRNPFVTDIETIDENFAKALVNVVTRTRMHNAVAGDAILEPATYESELARFRTLFHQLLQEHNKASIDKLLKFYESEDEARLLLDKLLETLSESKDPAKLTTMAMETLPNLCMPHDSNGSLEEIQSKTTFRVENMSRMIHRAKKQSGSDPFIVTIARSTLDGFTPSSVVEKLQNNVLAAIHETYCGCDLMNQNDADARFSFMNVGKECRFKVIFDYGEREGASFES